MKLQITERGWAGHFILAMRCQFRRNTLISDGAHHVVVSSVGALVTPDSFNANRMPTYDTVGLERTYETMVFRGKVIGAYIDADTCEQIGTDEEWRIPSKAFHPKLKPEDDLRANDIHEANVTWVRKNWKKIHATPTQDGEG